MPRITTNLASTQSSATQLKITADPSPNIKNKTLATLSHKISLSEFEHAFAEFDRLIKEADLNLKLNFKDLKYFFQTNIIYKSDLEKLTTKISKEQSEKLLDALIKIHNKILRIAKPEDKAKKESLFLLYFYACIKFTRDSRNPDELITSTKLIDHLIKSFVNHSTNPKFISTLLSLYAEKLTESQAEHILSKAARRKELSEDLSQLIFQKYPQLKKDFLAHDFSQVSYEDLCKNLDHYGKLALNQAELLSKSGTYKGKLGIELEAQMVKTFNGEPFRTQLKALIGDNYSYSLDRLIIENDAGKFVRNSYQNYYEIRNKGRGKLLNTEFVNELLSIKIKFLQSPYFRAFNSHHIHVDKLKNFRPSFAPVLFRRYILDQNEAALQNKLSNNYDKGYEAQSVPLAYDLSTKRISLFHESFFQISRLIDQMQIINGLYDLDLDPKDYYIFTNNLSAKEIRSLPNLIFDFQSQNSQNLICKFYLCLAYQHERLDLIPQILRCHQKLCLPNVGNYLCNLASKHTPIKDAEKFANTIAKFYKRPTQNHKYQDLVIRLNPAIINNIQKFTSFAKTLLKNTCSDLLCNLILFNPWYIQSIKNLLLDEYQIPKIKFDYFLDKAYLNSLIEFEDPNYNELFHKKINMEETAKYAEFLDTEKAAYYEILRTDLQEIIRDTFATILFLLDKFRDQPMKAKLKSKLIEHGRLVFNWLEEIGKHTKKKHHLDEDGLLTNKTLRDFLGISPERVINL